MPTMTLMTGNVGCGKSFLSSKIAKRDGAVVVCMDKLYELLEGWDNAPYNNKRKLLYQAAEDHLIISSIKLGYDVVIDRTLMTAERRKHFIKLGKEANAHIIGYDFGAGEEKDLKQRQRKPRGVSGDKWEDVFMQMRDQYEKPDISEGYDVILFPPEKYRFFAFDFDGTIVYCTQFPQWGDIISATKDKMTSLYEDLSNVIIVWSCRSGDYENDMRQFLIKESIPFDFINENPLFRDDSRKIFAHEYYDDRNKFI